MLLFPGFPIGTNNELDESLLVTFSRQGTQWLIGLMRFLQDIAAFEHERKGLHCTSVDTDPIETHVESLNFSHSSLYWHSPLSLLMTQYANYLAMIRVAINYNTCAY